MFARGFTMNKDLPELWSAVREGTGEITGGMGVNTVATLAVITLDRWCLASTQRCRSARC